jgi:flagellar protein FlgJ
MEISSLGSLYLDDVRFAASSLGVGRNAPEGGGRRPAGTGAGGAGSGGFTPFAELLEKSRGETGSGGPVASVLKKPAADKTGPEDLKLYEQCEALETFLLKNLVKSMRSTIGKSPLIDTGFAGEIYEDMLYDEYTGKLAKNAGFGFAEMAYRELKDRRGMKVDLPGA